VDTDVESCRRALVDLGTAQAGEDYDRLYGAAWELRMHVYAKCPNGTVVREIEALRRRLISLPTMVWRERERAEQFVDEYRDLVSTFADRDEDAAAEQISKMMVNTGVAVAAYFDRLQSTSPPGWPTRGEHAHP
jgi:DNA-binding GntR family transcriptional regulator